MIMMFPATRCTARIVVVGKRFFSDYAGYSHKPYVGELVIDNRSVAKTAKSEKSAPKDPNHIIVRMTMLTFKYY